MTNAMAMLAVLARVEVLIPGALSLSSTVESRVISLCFIVMSNLRGVKGIFRSGYPPGLRDLAATDIQGYRGGPVIKISYESLYRASPARRAPRISWWLSKGPGGHEHGLDFPTSLVPRVTTGT
ncbi:hypothetical protein F4804DRAFT_309667 [Jackrogersella minutella]|nr:hypothetical protein F4804DRAFT_309667 [Jackrogersella minutella]